MEDRWRASLRMYVRTCTGNEGQARRRAGDEDGIHTRDRVFGRRDVIFR